jgi:hypothetical protein
MGEAFVGVDLGRYSVRVSPRFEYFTIGAYPYRTLSVGWLAVEGAFRVTPWYEVSAAPLLGYSYANHPPPCTDVCYGESFSTELTPGVSVSPATVVFGPNRAFEAGLHIVLFDYPSSGLIYLGSYLDLRWFFLGNG